MEKIDSKNGIIGVALGDAMGVPVEFMDRKKLNQNPVQNMRGYGSHNVPEGCWSDDTSMTLATIDAMIEDKDINCETIAKNFVAWYKEAKYTATNKLFDIGTTCLRAIAKYESKEFKAEECGGANEADNGNGSLMRIAPMIYYCYAKKMQEHEIYEVVKRVSSITHAHEISVLGCFIYVLFGISLLKDNTLEMAYQNIKDVNYSNYFSDDAISRYNRILKQNIANISVDDIKSSGFVVDTLEATFWSLLNTDSFDSAILKAINLGNDTDTVGACVGGLAGIYYGIDQMNNEWQQKLLKYDYIIDMCKKFDEVMRIDY